MQLQPNRAIIPLSKQFKHWAVRGGAVGAMIPLIIAVLEAASLDAALLFLASGASIGGVVSGIAALALRRRQGSFDYTEKELRRVRTLLEQHLIDEYDYQRLKSRIIEQYSPSSLPAFRLWPAIMWGVFGGVTLPALFLAMAGGGGLIIFVPIAAGAAVAGGLLAGGVAQVLPMLKGSGPGLRLPAPKSRRLPGR